MHSLRTWTGIAAGILLLVILAFGGKYFPFTSIDHAVYWSAARITLDGENPYDTDTMVAKQLEIGQKVEEQEADLMMYWYPPWSLAVVLPLGLLTHKTSQLVWYLFSITAVLWSANKLWLLYGGERRHVVIAWALAVLFSPFWSMLFFGQISPVMLLGIMSLLLILPEDSSNPKKDFLAGMGICLLSIKPVMVYLVWSALLLWILGTRRWYVALGTVSAALGGLAISMIFNPQLPQQFIEFAAHQQATYWAVPTIGSWLRSTINPEKVWLQFIPMVFGFVWIFIYWLRQRNNWRWKEHLPLIICVSMIATPFTWTHDQVMLLPAIIAAATRVVKFPRWAAVVIGAAWLAFSLLTFMLHLTRGDQFFFWQVPLILLFYAIINRIRFITPQLNTA